MGIARKLIRFVAGTAIDVLLPNIVDKPWKIGRNFYQCFLTVNLNEQLQLLAEAGHLSTEQIEHTVEAIVAQWQQASPDFPLPPEARTLARQIVEGLCQASRVHAQSHNAAESVRQSLNQSLLAKCDHQIQPLEISAGQKAVGSLLTLSLLQASESVPDIHLVQLPKDAPQIPGYEMLRLLGSGGFSTVYLARHLASDEMRAIKVGDLGEPKRLRREIDILQNIKSEYLVDYHEHGELDDKYWIAMTYLGEHSLFDLLTNPNSRPDAMQTLLIGEQILRGLAALHENGIIHRDLKPANVMIDQEFRLKLIDFGLAKAFQNIGGDSRSTTVTVAGQLVGTPQYMSPEQVHGITDINSSTDMWSFGVLLYEMFTGTSLFQANTLMALGSEILNRGIDVDSPSIPEEFRPFIASCLNRDVAKRFSQAVNVLPQYLKLSSQTVRRLQYDRYRDSWKLILEKQLLEKFAAQCKGILPSGCVAEFIQFAQPNGIETFDEALLAEVLPAVISQQTKLELISLDIERSKRTLQEEIVSLTADQIQSKTEQVKQLEEEYQKQLSLVSRTTTDLVFEKTGARKQLTEEKNRNITQSIVTYLSFGCLIALIWYISVFLLGHPEQSPWIYHVVTCVLFGLFGVLAASVLWGAVFSVTTKNDLIGAFFGNILWIFVLFAGPATLSAVCLGSITSLLSLELSPKLVGGIIAFFTAIIGSIGVTLFDEVYGRDSKNKLSANISMWVFLITPAGAVANEVLTVSEYWSSGYVHGMATGAVLGLIGFTTLLIVSEKWRSLECWYIGIFLSIVVGFCSTLFSAWTWPAVGLAVSLLLGLFLFQRTQQSIRTL